MARRNGGEASPIAGPLGREAASEVDPAIAAWRFDRFTFDRHRSELRRDADGTVSVLRPKAEALLCTFLRHPRRLLSRDDLIGSVWRCAVVTDDSLVHCIGELRVALDDHDQRLVRTVPRRGYVFEAPVEALTSVPLTRASLAPLPASSPPAAARSVHAPSPVRAAERRWQTRRLAAFIFVCGAATGIALNWQATRRRFTSTR